VYLRILAHLLMLLASASALHANFANGDPRLERLYARFIAPCCWRENLLTHHSPLADQIRSDIRKWLAEGKSDQQIKLTLTGQYSTRVLSMPEGTRAQWLSWPPVVAVVAGTILTIVVIRRLRNKAMGFAGGPGLETAQLPEVDWE
jgi:cytochrome c-type biogenesis protein CcmH/NrfF